MTQTKHTPGPWDYGKLGNDADQWAVYDPNGRTIGLSYHGEANARLIAVAPELLEALEELADAADEVGVNHFDTDTMDPYVQAMQAATQAARSIIAKGQPANPIQERTQTMEKRQFKTVTRYCVTHLDREGRRALSYPAQGRYSFATEKEAADLATAISGNNSVSNIVQVFGPQALGTFEARPVECYAGHFDPVSIWLTD